jgi:teichuronic acid biosynthesis glycosyltransferase TuaG
MFGGVQMISVILTTYNRGEKFLSKAIRSVINQSHKDWELIIVDDCSTDKTKDYCDKYVDKPIGLMTPNEAINVTDYPHDSRISYIRLDKNFGSDTKPKNEGFKISRGEYVLFLDDDVTLRKHALRSLVKHMGKYDVVYGDMWIKPNEEPGIAYDFDRQFLMFRNFIDTSCCFNEAGVYGVHWRLG